MKPFENTVGKGKMLVTSIFSFSLNVFYPIKNRNYFTNISFVVCKWFEFGQVRELSFGKELTLSQTSLDFHGSAV